jgi:hypothetical protein
MVDVAMAARLEARSLLRTTLAFLLLLWLVEETVAGTIKLARPLVLDSRLWRSALETPLEERRRRTLDERDHEAGRPRGYVSGIVDALLAHVPEHATVHAAGFQARKEAQALVPVPHLCFPRRLAWAPADLPLDGEPLAQSYLLTFDEELSARLRSRKTPLASGPGWILWH